MHYYIVPATYIFHGMFASATHPYTLKVLKCAKSQIPVLWQTQTAAFPSNTSPKHVPITLRNSTPK